MEKKKPYKSTSYSEIMKSLNSPKKAQELSPIDDMYIQIILDEAMLSRQITLLEEKIDDALISMNKPLFLEFSATYAELIHEQQMLFEKRMNVFNNL